MEVPVYMFLVNTRTTFLDFTNKGWAASGNSEHPRIFKYRGEEIGATGR